MPFICPSAVLMLRRLFVSAALAALAESSVIRDDIRRRELQQNEENQAAGGAMPQFNNNNSTNTTTDDGGGGGGGGRGDLLPVAVVNTIVYFTLILAGCFILYTHVSRPRWCRCFCGQLDDTAATVTPVPNRHRNEHRSIPRRSKAERMQDLRNLFERLKLQTIVTEDDFKEIAVDGGDASDTNDDASKVSASVDDIETGSTHNNINNSNVPIPIPPSRKFYHKRHSSGMVLTLPARGSGTFVNNCCAICLESYKPGDAIVWSNNIKCPHVYHTDCLVEYFASPKVVHEGHTPCPFCRQTFCVHDEDEEEEQGRRDRRDNITHHTNEETSAAVATAEP